MDVAYCYGAIHEAGVGEPASHLIVELGVDEGLPVVVRVLASCTTSEAAIAAGSLLGGHCEKSLIGDADDHEGFDEPELLN